MTTQPPIYVLDSFALLAFFQEEPGGHRVREALHQAESGEVRLAMAVVNLGEVFYRSIRNRGSERAEEVLSFIATYAIDFYAVEWDLALAAAGIKGIYRMSYADCIAAALAQHLGATLMTGDPEFEQIAVFVDIEWLPRAR